MRVLVTGAAGFLARHLMAEGSWRHGPVELVAQVEAPARWQRWSWARSQPRTTVLAAPLARPDEWGAHPSLAGLQGIFHLAGVVCHSRQPPPSMWQVNVESTLAMVRLARRLRVRLVTISSSGTVGCSRDPAACPDEHAPFCSHVSGKWPYYHSKIEGERQASALAHQLGVELVILRPPVLLGPLDHRLRSTGQVARLLAGRLPVVVPGGMHFADVRDVARAAWAAMRRPMVQPRYNLPGHATSLEAFFRRVAALAGCRPPRLTLPASWLLAVARLDAWAGRRRGGQGPLALMDPVVVEMAAHHWGLGTRFATELGYRPRAADATLADTIAWLRRHHPACRQGRRPPSDDRR